MATNRITAAIERTKRRIEERLLQGKTTEEAVRNLHKALDIEMVELIVFQERKSLAFAQGLITLEEAQTIYDFLGESGVEKFNGQPIEVKSVLTSFFAELLAKQIKLS